MSGRKQFDEAEVLDAAMTAFWREGYEATSVSDLESATGLNKSSLYNAYGSKEALYTRCLERFGELHGQRLVEQLDQPDFAQSIEAFFVRLADRLEDHSLPDGCLATMAAMEFGGKGGEASKRAEVNLEAMRQAFHTRCRQAIKDGQLADDTDCEAVAAMLLAMTRGIAVLNRGHPDRQIVRTAIRGMLSGLAQIDRLHS